MGSAIFSGMEKSLFRAIEKALQPLAPIMRPTSITRDSKGAVEIRISVTLLAEKADKELAKVEALEKYMASPLARNMCIALIKARCCEEKLDPPRLRISFAACHSRTPPVSRNKVDLIDTTQQHKNTARHSASPAKKTPPPLKADAQKPARMSTLSQVRRIFLVVSAKGGVGKSTLSLQLALACRRFAKNIGLADGDIHGPSLPQLARAMPKSPLAIDFAPVKAQGLRIMSMGFLIDPGKALGWRGPMASRALLDLLSKTRWGPLEALIVDTPPGTGDIHLSLGKSLPIDGVVMVTTAHPLALQGVERALSLYRLLDIPILGLIDNMCRSDAAFSPAVAAFCTRMQIPLLASIPDKPEAPPDAHRTLHPLLDPIAKRLLADGPSFHARS